jgi:hypothetical protein
VRKEERSCAVRRQGMPGVNYRLEKASKDSPIVPAQRNNHTHTLLSDSGILTYKRINSVISDHPLCGHLKWQHQKMNTIE